MAKAIKANAVKEPVVKQDEKSNPSDAMAIEDSMKKRAPGNWIKATPEEIKKHEEAGTLVGHDPVNGHVLLLEE